MYHRRLLISNILILAAIKIFVELHSYTGVQNQDIATVFGADSLDHLVDLTQQLFEGLEGPGGLCPQSSCSWYVGNK